MTRGKRVRLPAAPELTDGPDLTLRQPHIDDVSDIVAQCRDPEFQRWTRVPVPYHESDAQDFVKRVGQGWRANVAMFAIAYHGRFSGSVDLRFDGVGGAEVGFGLAPWARGNGVMTRALRLVLAWAFGLPGIEVVYWRAQVGNWASRRVAGRCGFQMEGTVRGLLEQRGEPTALAIHFPSRPFLECHVRRRVHEISSVTILSGHEVVEVLSTPDRRGVTGVRVAGHDGGVQRELTADVVMDAMGRGAHTPALLESLGYGRPVEDHVVMHTNYVSQLLRIPHGTLTEMLADIGPAPDRPAGMFLSGYENDTWMFTVFGMVGHQPPRDLAGMLSFAREYCPAHLIAAVQAGEPIGEVAHHHMPSSQWRRYDKMPELPDGLLVCGDAICSVNPIYGQGMTLAALQAVALRACLQRGDVDLPRRYFRAAAKPIDVAWQMVASLDLAFPGVAGRRSRWMRIATRLVDWAMTASESDLVVAVRFFRVNSLIDSPIRLLHPAFVYRVAVENLRRRRAARYVRHAAAAPLG